MNKNGPWFAVLVQSFYGISKKVFYFRTLTVDFTGVQIDVHIQQMQECRIKQLNFESVAYYACIKTTVSKHY